MTLGLREFHSFEAAGRRYLYLVPSAAVFALDDCSEAILHELRGGPQPLAHLTTTLTGRFDALEVTDTIAELQRVRALAEVTGRPPAPMPKIVPLRPVPLQTLVVNVTNQCNLACTYCYEYGEDKIVDTTNGLQPKFMSEETARDSVEFALRESRENTHAHITFFGGETLHYFALALTIGICFGIYSSVLVASPIVMWLRVSREDLVKPEKKAETIGAAF